jgi:hypothetical protein
MSKRLQVVVKDDELEHFERTADVLGLSLSEWVRQSLRAAERQVSTGDVETMLAEIEAGRLAEIEAGMGGGDA